MDSKLVLVLLLAVLAAGGVAASAAEPAYWRQRVFFIPYQAVEQSRFAPQVAKVQLLIARDGGGQWTVLQEAEPHVRGFSYHAPADGDYAFAVQTTNSKGDVAPAVVSQPQLRVVVDTAAPTLDLSVTSDGAGRIVVRYESRDLHLRPETLRLETRVDRGEWQRIATGPPEVSQPDRLLGKLAWAPPASAAAVEFRGVIDDKAGNQTTAAAEASLVGPVLSPAAGPVLGSAAGGAAAPPASTAGPSPSATILPPSPEGPSFPTDAASPAQPPPALNPYATPPAASTTAATAPLTPPAAWSAARTPAQLVADTGPAAPAKPSSNWPAASSGVSNPFAPPPLFDGPSPAASPPGPANGATTTGAAPGGWTAAPAPEAVANELRWVNSLTFDVDYELQTVGPWGVSKVELWATRDGGREWVNFGADPDNRGPMRVTVPAPGVYGFRLVVNGANGAPAPTPTPGQPPEMSIGVDLEEPLAELQAAGIGEGNLSDHLIIRWTASDANPDARPAAIFFSTESEGPWTTIATNLENNGQYAWRLPQQIPEKLFLRLEVRDLAGNVAVRQSPAPVVLNLPQPSGRLRNVRPVNSPDDPQRFRTARHPGRN